MGNGILLLVIVAAPFAASLLAAFLPLKSHNAAATLAGATALLGIIVAVVLYPAIGEGGIVRLVLPWIPELGLDISLRLDGFAWLFAMLVTGIGFLVVLYARYYMSPDDPVPRFFSFFLAFMGAMLGIVLSGNLIQLVFFWELTSLFSFLLIGYWHHNAAARDGARMALTITAAGGLCLFSGVLLLGHIVGSYDLDRVLASGRRDPAQPALPAGAGAGPARRADQERAVSVPLLAAARDGGADAGLGLPAFGDHGEGRRVPAGAPVAGAGGHRRLVLDRRHRRRRTLLLGAYVAIFQHDLKGLLAYSTISHLGLITLLLGLGTPAGGGRGDLPHHEPRDLQGVAVHGGRHHRPRDGHARHPAPERAVPLHADHRDAGDGGSRGHGRRAAAQRLPVQGDVLRRSRRKSRQYDPRPFAALRRHAGGHVQRRLFAALHPRRLLRACSEDLPRDAARAAALDAVSGRASGARLPGGRRAPGADDRAVPRTSAVRSVLGPETPAYSLALWHGFNLPLLMSVIALLGGIILYRALQTYLATRPGWRALPAAAQGPAHLRGVLVTVSWSWARALERLLGTRRLQPQLRLLVGIASARRLLAAL